MQSFPEISDKNVLETGAILAPRFDTNGLITAVVQDADSNKILMLAHMNADALQKSIDTGQSHFWSRSRQELWHKGATSGNFQNIREILIDCDQDAIILKVTVNGEASCHTGEESCFFRKISSEDEKVVLIKELA